MFQQHRTGGQAEKHSKDTRHSTISSLDQHRLARVLLAIAEGSWAYQREGAAVTLNKTKATSGTCGALYEVTINDQKGVGVCVRVAGHYGPHDNTLTSGPPDFTGEPIPEEDPDA